MNTLAQRLKFAKQEITALKTAHQRGFGLLKIYRTEYKFSDIPGVLDTHSYDAITTINFSQNYAPYPFAYLNGQFVSWFSSLDVKQIQYSNNGYTITFTGDAFYYTSLGLDKMTLYSTAPPTSISYNWS